MPPTHIIITGASSGLGKAMYNRGKECWDDNGIVKVLGVGRNGPDITVDLSSRVGRANLISHIEENGWEVGHLINNAGVLLLDESDYDSSLEMVHLNLIAVWDLIRRMVDKNLLKYSIINIASVSGIKGEAELPLYSATKAGVVALTKSFAAQLAPKGIRVNSISPGLFRTSLCPGETPQELIDSVPLKREARPDEIIPLTELLLSGTGYITGSNMVIDGGALL